MASIRFFGHVIEGQDVVDAVAQGDKLEALEIVRVESRKWNAIEAFVRFKRTRLKQQAACRIRSKNGNISRRF
jgi:peptidyl-prolyl cis-trans isomerase A (cyclophilin A)